MADNPPAPRQFWFFSINYAPEPTGFGPHVAALCEHLAGAGHRVTVFTGFPFAPHWKRWPEYRRGFVRTEPRNGVSVVRLTHYIPRTPRRIIERLAMEGTFCLMAVWVALLRLLRQGRPDAVIYVGAQPSLAMLTRSLSTVLRVPYGIMVNDLATGAASDVGIVRSQFLLRALHGFEFAAYRRAKGAVVLCESFRDALTAEGMAAEKIRIVRSPVDVEMIRPSSEGPAFRQRLGITESDFVVMFAGSMGLKQAMENIVAAAEYVARHSKTVRWILIGEGEARASVANQILEFGLGEQVTILPYFPTAELSGVFAAADVLLLNQKRSVKDTVIPSKLLTYMAAGRPVVAAVNASSQGAVLLRQSGGGEIVEPESPSALGDVVLRLLSNRASLGGMGRANRMFAEENFDQRRILKLQELFSIELTAK